MNDQIELPAEVVSEYYENDSVRAICSPPAGVPSPEWATWARKAFPLPVTSVERIAEGGRLLLAVTLGETDEGATPKTFRLIPPPQKGIGPEVTLTVNGISGWTPPPPTPAQPPAPTDTCSRPVRVRADTHARIRTLSKRLGLGIADTIHAAVDAMIDG